MSDKKHLVFCYGTLKQGFGNHHRLADSPFVGHAITSGVMYDLGAFPAVSLHGTNQIHGELYEVTRDVLMDLDRLEGYPYLYERDKVETNHGPAWIYHMKRDSELSNHRIVASGVWGDNSE